MTGINGLQKNTKGARMARGEKLTNYEKIKSMSVDEMAEFLEDEDNLATQYCNKKCCVYFEDNGDCKAYKAVKRNSCVQAVKQWLESEVEE